MRCLSDRIGGELLEAQMLYLDACTMPKGMSRYRARFGELFKRWQAGEVRKLGDFR
jgi:hypothetical protein